MLSHLTELGLAGVAVESGEQALEELATRTFCAVLMDCFMPRMSGYETTQRIREGEPEGVRIPVVAVSANAIVGARARCIAAGMDDFIAKPFTAEVLGVVLRRWLTLPVREPAAAPEPATAPEAVVIERETVDMLARLGVLPAVVKLYLSGLSGQVAEIRQAASAGDLSALRSASHRLRGSSAQLGVTEFARVCAALEEAAAHDDLGAARIAAAEVIAREGDVVAAVRALVDESAG